MDIFSFVVQNRQSVAAFHPELALLAGCMFLLLLGAFAPKSRGLALFVGIASVAGFGVLSVPLLQISGMVRLFSGAITADSFGVFFKFFFAAVSLITMILVVRSDELKEAGLAEILAFLVALTLGLSMMAASTDLLMMYLSLEMVSVLSYILVGYKRHSRASSEAGLKYILYGAFSSGVMIYGLSYLYGMAGTTDLIGVAAYFRSVQGVGSAAVTLFALLCTMIGFGFKIAVFPTQMWCPDVYEGAATPITAFLSVGPKAAGFAMLMRFFVVAFDVKAGHGTALFEYVNWGLVMSVLAAVTMTIGNLAAIPQRNLKRLMAYSSIAQAGYLLMGFSALSAEGVEAVLFYLVTYLLMNFGVFLVIIVVAQRLGTEDIDGYRGLGFRAPLLAIMLTVFLFSLTGLPPFAGFIGKVLLFGAILQKGSYWLATVAALNTVISLFYYARIIRRMYLDKPLMDSPVRAGAPALAFAALLAIPTLLIGLFWEPLARFTQNSVASLFG